MKNDPNKQVAQGYGLALLLVFFLSSVMTFTSTSLLLAPVIGGYTGAVAVDSSSATQLGELALNAAQADIFTQQNSGTIITTSYRFPSSGNNTISIPTYPGSGVLAAKGTYYVTTIYARGYTFLLAANITVGSVNKTVYRLLHLDNTPLITNRASAIYSLRKVRSSYSGYAAQVRCASNPDGATTVNIGFDAEGDFDVAGLRSCLKDTILPLDITAGRKLAYGLRRLSSSYNGFAIRVRRSSDNTPQDIGFDADGNLDTVALKSFVGSGSGYVATWYDQSGFSKNATQTNNADQPRIVNAGTLETSNNAPSVYFDGTDYLQNTALGGTHITGANITTFVVAREDSTGTLREVINLHKNTGEGYTYQSSGAADLFYFNPGGELAMDVYMNIAMGTFSTPTNLFQATSYSNGTTLRVYGLGSLLGNTTASPPSLSPTTVYIGVDGYNAGASTGWNLVGHLSEVIIFSAALTDINRTAIERSQGHYYNIAGMADGYITTWYDQGGNGLNATQATAANQPTIATQGVVFPNGAMKPAIRFDGTNDYLATAASTVWPSGSADRSMNAIYQLNATAGNKSVFGWGTIGSGTFSYMFHDLNIGFWGFNADVKTSSTPDIISGHRIGIAKTGSTVTVYKDGVALNSGSPSLNTPSNTVLSIGRDSGGGSYMSGNEAEIMLFDFGLNSNQVVQLEANQTSYYGP